jgi:sec-independent protein translocase protein TatB
VFEGRFSEILIIFVLALVVLGPEKLPRVVSEFGRWVGRARAMARQFREQLEEEVQLEEARKKARGTPPPATQPEDGMRGPFPNTHNDPSPAPPAPEPAQAASADERGT